MLFWCLQEARVYGRQLKVFDENQRGKPPFIIMSKAIYRRYRPSTFKEVSGQEHVVRTIQNQYNNQSIAHAYLFTGPRGVGKTTIARLLAKLVNCKDPKENEPCNACESCTQIISGQALDIYEIDAASHTDVENVRENIIKSVRFAPNQLKKKVFIIDEVHMLSASAFNALLKTIEEPPDHVLFVLATTEIHKVPDTIISRCQRFDFRKIAPRELLARLNRIVKDEGVRVDEDVLLEVARLSEGCARDAESLLGQILALGEKEIKMKEARLVLPMTQWSLVEDFAAILEARDAAKAIEKLNTYLEQGVDLQNFVSDIIRFFRDKLLLAVARFEDSRFYEDVVGGLLEAGRSIRNEHIPQLPVELAIVRVCTKHSFQKREVDLARASEKVETVHIQPDKSESTIEIKETAPAKFDEFKETVFDTVPVISIDEVKEKWPQIYEQIKMCNASLPLMMESCEVRGIDCGQVELGFEYDIYVQAVNKEKNRALIEDVLQKVLGTRLSIRAIKTDIKEDDETLKALVGEFGGSVVH